MKLVILVSFLLLLPMFSSGVVDTLLLDNVNHEKMVKKEVVMNGKRIDLEIDYAGPHLRPSDPSDPPKKQVDEVVTKEPPVYIKDDYKDPAPIPVIRRPVPYLPRPPPPPPHHKSVEN
ncbi:PREDICTED: uncharacterized protein LOC104706742 [Camelina sativa]|uniref:Uncharacterized protein LOC104706742 n=1 Tax=Camelina sativa TaxID=90675 RepID=A0ABM0T5Q0_CAMSA|nr:PREDICTED: uncharacterized protein LOC104706742 [Camelina sativa]